MFGVTRIVNFAHGSFYMLGAYLGVSIIPRLLDMASSLPMFLAGVLTAAIGVEVEDEDYASEVGDACCESGLLVSAEEDVLMLFPALNIRRSKGGGASKGSPAANEPSLLEVF